MSTIISPVVDDFILNAVSAHGNFKLGMQAYAEKNPKGPLSVVYTAAGQLVQKLETDKLPALHNAAPQKVVSFVSNYFEAVTVAAVAGCLKGIFSYNSTISGGAVLVLSYLNKDIRSRSLAKDFAICNLPSHSWNFVSHSIDFVFGQDPIAGVSAVFDAACAVKLGLIILDKDNA